MDRKYLFDRIKALQRELSEIAQHNRTYFKRKHHSPKDESHHLELQERIYQIRAELYVLIEGAA